MIDVIANKIVDIITNSNFFLYASIWFFICYLFGGFKYRWTLYTAVILAVNYIFTLLRWL